MSGYLKSLYIDYPDIEAYVGMIQYPDVKKSLYLSSPDIESFGYKNMPFDAL